MLLRSESFSHRRSRNDISYSGLLIALCLNLPWISEYVMDKVNIRIKT